jgi:plasmid stability protein
LKAISIRNVPDDVYFVLQEMAKANRRSLQEQIKYILEQEVTLIKGSPMAKAAKWRKHLQGRQLSDAVRSMREDRER